MFETPTGDKGDVTEIQITNHIRNTYNPDAIILHGSRARGKEREHSDWDTILLYKQTSDVGSGRELYKGQNIEYSIHTLPIIDIAEQFGVKLQGASVLYEKEDIGTSLLQKAADYYAKGVHWSEEKITSHQLWVEGRVNGMKDNIDNPIIFEKYFADFYGRVFNYWYWVLQNKHSQPIYIATAEVAEADPGYHELVSNLVDSELSPAQKVAIAEKIHALLFLTKHT